MKKATLFALVVTGIAAMAMTSCKSKNQDYPAPAPGYIESSSK